MTAEYFSALYGVTTVWNLSSAIAHAFGSSSSASSSSTSSSTTNTDTRSLTQRKRAFPDELMRLPPGRQLVFIDHHHPIMGLKRRWYEDDGLRLLGRNLRAEKKVTVA